MSKIISLIKAWVIMLMLTACTTTCEEAYSKYYKKNISYYVQEQKNDDASIELKYLPYAMLPANVQQDTADTYFYLVEMSGTQNLSLSEMAFRSDSIFYLRNIESGEVIYPDFVHPEMTGLQYKARFFIGFEREQMNDHNFLFNAEDIFFSKSIYSFPIETAQLQLLENRYCIQNDQD